MSEWKEYKLSELMNIIGGGTPKTTDKSYWGGVIPWLSVVDFGNSEKKVYKTEKSITEKGLNESSTKLLKKGQLIISARGTVGELAILGADMAFNQSCYGLDAYSDICTNDFLYYLIKYKITELKRNAHGAVFDTITRNTFDTISAYVPDLPTQIAIAEILSSLDDKIELNNKINQELEALAQTIFKRWFVDFEFPNENGEPYKSSGGEMVDSELGEIPKGWVVKKLNEFAICYDSKRIPLSSMERNIRKGLYPYYGAASLMDYIDDYIFDGEYVLMGEDGSVIDNLGYPILQYVFGKFWVNNHAHVLEGRIISTELLLCLLRNTNVTELVTGAVQPKLNQGNMNKISMPLPLNIGLLTNLEASISGIFSLIRNSKIEITELTNLRDTLLPKLISGELEVS